MKHKVNTLSRHLPRQIPKALPLILPPTSGDRAHSSPTPHRPATPNGPPHVSFTSNPHTSQHPHASRILPRVQFSGTRHPSWSHWLHNNASTPAWFMYIPNRHSSNTRFTSESRRQSPGPLSSEERIPTLHLETVELERNSPSSDFLYPVDNTKNKRSSS